MRKETVYKIFSNMPTIKTERLTLRPMHIIDAEDMYDYARREEVTRYLLWNPHSSISVTKDYLRYIGGRYALGDFYDWSIIDRESRRMIGTCGFTRIETANNAGEIGYVLNPDFHGRGYATEAAGAVLKFGFETLELNRIEARFMKGNDASLGVMKRLGMTFEGYHADAIFVKGSYRTVGVCAILKEEFTKNSQIPQNSLTSGN